MNQNKSRICSNEFITDSYNAIITFTHDSLMQLKPKVRRVMAQNITKKKLSDNVV